MGGWWTKSKLTLFLTQVEVEVEVGVELGKILGQKTKDPRTKVSAPLPIEIILTI